MSRRAREYMDVADGVPVLVNLESMQVSAVESDAGPLLDEELQLLVLVAPGVLVSEAVAQCPPDDIVRTPKALFRYVTGRMGDDESFDQMWRRRNGLLSTVQDSLASLRGRSARSASDAALLRSVAARFVEHGSNAKVKGVASRLEAMCEDADGAAAVMARADMLWKTAARSLLTNVCSSKGRMLCPTKVITLAFALAAVESYAVQAREYMNVADGVPVLVNLGKIASFVSRCFEDLTGNPARALDKPIDPRRERTFERSAFVPSEGQLLAALSVLLPGVYAEGAPGAPFFEGHLIRPLSPGERYRKLVLDTEQHRNAFSQNGGEEVDPGAKIITSFSQRYLDNAHRRFNLASVYVARNDKASKDRSGPPTTMPVVPDDFEPSADEFLESWPVVGRLFLFIGADAKPEELLARVTTEAKCLGDEVERITSAIDHLGAEELRYVPWAKHRRAFHMRLLPILSAELAEAEGAVAAVTEWLGRKDAAWRARRTGGAASLK